MDSNKQITKIPMPKTITEKKNENRSQIKQIKKIQTLPKAIVNTCQSAPIINKRAVLRRSKSISEFNVKPLAKLNIANREENRKKLRRSVSDLNVNVLPKFKPTLKPLKDSTKTNFNKINKTTKQNIQALKIENKVGVKRQNDDKIQGEIEPAKISKPMKPAPYDLKVENRVGVKRKNDKLQGDIEPAKISKPMKPPPYDYKARFNLLTEKYTALREELKVLKKVNEDAAKDVEAYVETKSELEIQKKENITLIQENEVLKSENSRLRKMEMEYDNLKIEIKNIKELNNTLENNNKNLKEKNVNLEEQLSALEDKYATLLKQHECLMKESNILRTEYNSTQQIKISLENDLASKQSKIEELSKSLQIYKENLAKSETARRMLNNTVQDLKGNIRVFCRIRPQKTNETDKLTCLFNFPDESTVEIRKTRESFSISGKPVDLKQQFTFDKVFPPSSSQYEVFEDLAQLVQSALDGYNVCVFAYGQTGSGKTYTMQGETTPQDEGMIPRSINLLFQKIKELSECGWTYTIECSFLEIYNENIKDLLNTSNKQLDIKFNEGKGTFVTNLTQKKINSVNDIRSLMIEARDNRAVAATNFNEHSSRSHAVTKILIQGQNPEFKATYIGSLNLVDLAGSESAKTSTEERLAETKAINKSLSTLGNVMLALHNKDPHIPYRNSKLTFLLQSCLGGNSKTLMFVNVAPFEECFNETINSMRFAAKVKEVKTNSKKNKIYSTTI